jgi:putative drug exporter of the RND superfamily
LDRFFDALGRTVVRFRYAIVLAWIILIVVASRTLPSLGSEVNNDNSQFLPASAPSSVAARLATPIFGNPNTTSEIAVVAARTNRTLSKADAPAIAREAMLLRRVHRVESVRVGGISSDGKAVQLIANVRVNQADISRQKTVVDDVIATFKHAHAPPGLQFDVAGSIATNVANQASSNKTGSRTQSFTLLFVIVLLLFVFRSVLAPIITLLPPAFALLVSDRFIGGLGAHGLKISEITQLLLIVLLIGAGTDYGLFLVFRVREQIRSGQAPHDAVRHALVRVGESISASAGTVIFALLSLLFASFGIYHDLGIPLALGIAVMLLAGLTLLPALLAIFGKAAFWPSNLEVGSSRVGAWGKVASRLVQRPALTLATGVIVFGALAAALVGYHSGGFGGAINAPSGSNAAKGNALVSRHFPQSSTNPANLVFRYREPIWDDPQTVATAASVLRSSGNFKQFAGPFDPNGTTLTGSEYSRLHAELGPPSSLPAVADPVAGVSTSQYDAYRATQLFVSKDGRTIQFEASLRVGGQQTTAALNATPKIRTVVSEAASRSGAAASGVAGEAAALYDVSSTSNHDLLRVIPIAIVAIAILLALVLRSTVAPLYLIFSVALSYLAALGLSTILFIDLGGSGGLKFILPFLMFIFLLALGEDYNILVMTRIREEADGRPLRDAVVRAVGVSGPTVTAAGVVLAGSFGVLGLVAGSTPGASQIRDIGFGLAIGILMDTFLVRTLLVPSTVALLGRWNWWPGRLGRRPSPSEP